MKLNQVTLTLLEKFVELMNPVALSSKCLINWISVNLGLYKVVFKIINFKIFIWEIFSYAN